MDKKRRKKADIVSSASTPDATSLSATSCALIDAGRTHVAQAVNAGIVLQYWSVGDRIRREILGEKRRYGKQIVSTVSRQLSAEYGRGFGRRNLFRMVRFRRGVSWIDRLCRRCLRNWAGVTSWSCCPSTTRSSATSTPKCAGWSGGASARFAKIGKMLYERTAIAKKSEEVIRRELQGLRDEDRLTPDLVFRGPYVLDFLQALHDSFHQEIRDESALLHFARIARR